MAQKDLVGAPNFEIACESPKSQESKTGSAMITHNTQHHELQTLADFNPMNSQLRDIMTRSWLRFMLSWNRLWFPGRSAIGWRLKFT